MCKQKLTPWFVNGEKPVRPGIYNVAGMKNPKHAGLFAHWGPRGWGAGADTPSGALVYRDIGFDPNYFHQTGSWRGLAEKPA